jgi:hypothetical protein
MQATMSRTRLRIDLALAEVDGEAETAYVPAPVRRRPLAAPPVEARAGRVRPTLAAPDRARPARTSAPGTNLS